MTKIQVLQQNCLSIVHDNGKGNDLNKRDIATIYYLIALKIIENRSLCSQLNEIDISPIEDFDAPYYEMKLVKSLINGIYQVSTRL